MPKSKRNKQISLTQTKKKGFEKKKKLVEEVKECVDKYTNIFLYSVNDMRNSKLKDVREQWKNSRFFFGRNKVMALALGRNSAEEYMKNLSKLSDRLKGQCGLLFCDETTEEVLQWFKSHSDVDFARTGNIATETVDLEEGPLPQFSHAIEPYLRELGMHTTLKKCVIHLVKPYQLCVEGKALTAENAKILKLLGHKMAEFQLTIECCWSKGGKFIDFKPENSENGNKMEVDSDDSSEAEMDLDEPKIKRKKMNEDKASPDSDDLLDDLCLVNAYDNALKVACETVKSDDKVDNIESGENKNFESDEKEIEEVEADGKESKNVESDEKESKNVESDEKDSKNVESDEKKIEEVEADGKESKNVESDEKGSKNVESDEKESKNVESDEKEMEEAESDEEEFDDDNQVNLMTPGSLDSFKLLSSTKKPDDKETPEIENLKHKRPTARKEVEVVEIKPSTDPSPIYKRLRSKQKAKIDTVDKAQNPKDVPEAEVTIIEDLSNNLLKTPIETGKLKRKKQSMTQRLSQKIESSPDDKSPVLLALRNRTVKIKKK